MAIFAMSRTLGDPRMNLLPEQGYGFDQEEWERAGERSVSYTHLTLPTSDLV